MIVLDTSGLYSALDASQPHHAAASEALERDGGPYLLSPFVLAEVDYFVTRDLDVRAELALLDDIERGSYRLALFDPTALRRARALVERWKRLNIGLTDASIVVLADEHRTNRVLTLDERHFRALRTLDGKRFELWPADA